MPNLNQDGIRFVPGLGWFQNDNRLPNFKPYHALVWPKDGKNGSKWGRMKDIFTCKGPDIYMTTSGHAGMAKDHRPLRSHWSQWEYMEDDPFQRDPRLSFNSNFEDIDLGRAPWVQKFGPDRQNKRYDFRTRKYGRVGALTYSDALWRGSNDKKVCPVWGRWRGYDGNYNSWLEFPPWT